jgi:hypothetical protein
MKTHGSAVVFAAVQGGGLDKLGKDRLAEIDNMAMNLALTFNGGGRGFWSTVGRHFGKRRYNR